MVKVNYLELKDTSDKVYPFYNKNYKVSTHIVLRSIDFKDSVSVSVQSDTRGVYNLCDVSERLPGHVYNELLMRIEPIVDLILDMYYLNGSVKSDATKPFFEQLHETVAHYEREYVLNEVDVFDLFPVTTPHCPSFYYDFILNKKHLERHAFVCNTPESAYEESMNKYLEKASEIHDLETAYQNLSYVYYTYMRDGYANDFWIYFMPRLIELLGDDSGITVKYGCAYYDGKKIIM